MRAAILSVLALAVSVMAGCSLDQILNGGGGGTDAGAATDAGADAAVEAGVTGAGCGVESATGTQLCVATSQCPTLVIDTEATPHCGFRIKGGSSELVCACGDSLCSMGAYTTCAQAQKLLASQSEQQVCMQVGEGRCSVSTAPAGSSGSSGSSANPTCDRVCLSECGGGAGCASICGC